MDNLHTRLLAKDDGRLEAAVGLVLLIGAVIVAAVSEEWPAWPLLVAGGLLLWAILLAPSSGIRSTGVVLCVASGHFVGDVEASAFIALLAFVVLEVPILVTTRVISRIVGSCGVVVPPACHCEMGLVSRRGGALSRVAADANRGNETDATRRSSVLNLVD